MKKIIYLIGVFVTVATVFAAIAVLLKKLKISLSIEGIDDDIIDEAEHSDIDLVIEEDEVPNFDETAGAVEEALAEMLSGEESDEITVEITEE